MRATGGPPRGFSAPLSVQILLLMLGGLVVAQMVTLGLTMLLPPPAPEQYRMEDIAAALSGARVKTQGGRPLMRTLRDAPPSLRSTGWLVSERSRHDLARLLNAPEADVRLLFYSPLPFAGAGGGGLADAGGQGGPMRLAAQEDGWAVRRVALDQVPPGRGAGGGGPGSGGFGGSGGGERMGRSGAFGEDGDRDASDRGRGGYGGRFGGGQGGRGSPGGPGGGGGTAGGGRVGGEAPLSSAPTTIDPPGSHNGTWLSLRDVQGGLGRPSPPAVRTARPAAAAGGLGGPPVSGAVIQDGMGSREGANRTAPASDETPADRASPTRPVTSPVVPRPATEVNAPGPPQSAAQEPRVATDEESVAGMGVIAPASLVAARSGDVGGYLVQRPALQPRGLFGLAPAPFVQGDFVAAVHEGIQWAVVQPQPETFPNSWQRRVLLWFAAAMAIVGPPAWLFARRLARPLDAFARAAERLGRDPSGQAASLAGPAEIGRAARAFNTMQARLKRFVDDRTAMVGAISHDLRTPLARMRFRMERAEPDLQRPMLHDIRQMEEMISSVLVFIREASEPSVRERIDLRSIVECVVDDAALLGGDAELESGQAMSVEVDALGVQRVLANLVDNALKYGRRAGVRLYADGFDAIAEVVDDGPGLATEELERVFQPFYRAEASRSLNAGGIGLGLAVSRSIARAHGGDVSLSVGHPGGVVAKLRLPLAAAI